MDYVDIKLDRAIFTLVSATSLRSNVSFIISSSNIRVLFTNRLKPLESDKVILNLSYNESSYKISSMEGSAMFEGGIEEESLDAKLGYNNFLIITNAPFGRATGLVIPRSADSSVSLYRVGSSTVATDFEGNDLIVTTSTGEYLLDKIIPGNYTVIYSGKSYYSDSYGMTNIIITANRITNLPMVKMLNTPLRANAITNQYVSAPYPYDTIQVIDVPPATITNDYIPEIFVTNLPSISTAITFISNINIPMDLTTFEVVNINLYTLGPIELVENDISLKGAWSFKIPYSESYINSQGWLEDSLGVYYYSTYLNKWIKIGGKVNKDDNFIEIISTIQHRYYAVLSALDNDISLVSTIKVVNNPMTISIEDYNFAHSIITAELRTPVNSVEINIFSSDGRLVRAFEPSGTMLQIEQQWDGRDMNGNFVSSGIYIFEIIADAERFYGSIIIIK